VVVGTSPFNCSARTTTPSLHNVRAGAVTAAIQGLDHSDPSDVARVAQTANDYCHALLSASVNNEARVPRMAAATGQILDALQGFCERSTFGWWMLCVVFDRDPEDVDQDSEFPLLTHIGMLAKREPGWTRSPGPEDRLVMSVRTPFDDLFRHLHHQWVNAFMESWPAPEDGAVDLDPEREAELERVTERRDAVWKALVGAAHRLAAARFAGGLQRANSHINLHLCIAYASAGGSRAAGIELGQISRIDEMSHLTTGPPNQLAAIGELVTAA
jgi:hypothetical protein